MYYSYKSVTKPGFQMPAQLRDVIGGAGSRTRQDWSIERTTNPSVVVGVNDNSWFGLPTDFVRGERAGRMDSEAYHRRALSSRGRNGVPLFLLPTCTYRPSDSTANANSGTHQGLSIAANKFLR